MRTATQTHYLPYGHNQVCRPSAIMERPKALWATGKCRHASALEEGRSGERTGSGLMESLLRALICLQESFTWHRTYLTARYNRMSPFFQPNGKEKDYAYIVLVIEVATGSYDTSTKVGEKTDFIWRASTICGTAYTKLFKGCKMIKHQLVFCK